MSLADAQGHGDLLGRGHVARTFRLAGQLLASSDRQSFAGVQVPAPVVQGVGHRQRLQAGSDKHGEGARHVGPPRRVLAVDAIKDIPDFGVIIQEDGVADTVDRHVRHHQGHFGVAEFWPQEGEFVGRDGRIGGVEVLEVSDG